MWKLSLLALTCAVSFATAAKKETAETEINKIAILPGGQAVHITSLRSAPMRAAPHKRHPISQLSDADGVCKGYEQTSSIVAIEGPVSEDAAIYDRDGNFVELDKTATLHSIFCKTPSKRADAPLPFYQTKRKGEEGNIEIIRPYLAAPSNPEFEKYRPALMAIYGGDIEKVEEWRHTFGVGQYTAFHPNSNISGLCRLFGYSAAISAEAKTNLPAIALPAFFTVFTYDQDAHVTHLEGHRFNEPAKVDGKPGAYPVPDGLFITKLVCTK